MAQGSVPWPASGYRGWPTGLPHPSAPTRATSRLLGLPGGPRGPAAGRAVPSTQPEGAPRGAGRPLTSMLRATSSWQKYTASQVVWSVTAALQASQTEARNLSFCASR